MAAQALPEIVTPSELYIPDGKTGFSIDAASMPNGDASLLLTEEAGVEDFQAYIDVDNLATGEGTDWLTQPGECALSFWIRRNQLFDSGNTFFPSDSVSTSAIQPNHRLLMGVMDPLAVSLPAPTDRRISWAFVTFSTSQIQFVQNGYIPSNNWYWLSSTPIGLVEDQWHLVVVNREAANFSSIAGRGRAQVYLDGTKIGNQIYSSWFFYPNPVSGVDSQRFGIGDIMQTGQTVGGNAAGAAVNFSKIAFHNRNLTLDDMLRMLDAMRYGPAS